MAVEYKEWLTVSRQSSLPPEISILHCFIEMNWQDRQTWDSILHMLNCKSRCCQEGPATKQWIGIWPVQSNLHQKAWFESTGWFIILQVSLHIMIDLLEAHKSLTCIHYYLSPFCNHHHYHVFGALNCAFHVPHSRLRRRFSYLPSWLFNAS